MLVEVDWTYLNTRHRLWSDQLCLYAYLHPARDWLLYIGKADFQRTSPNVGRPQEATVT